jgi:hypothetical protein
MRKIIISFFVFILSLEEICAAHDSPTSQNYSIVFIHVGNPIPTYIKTAVMQARLFNPSAELYLIAEKIAYDEYQDSSNQIDLDECGLNFISCESLSPSKEPRDFNELSRLNKEFRNGFWHYASERFFYLEEFISQNNLINVFHLENDVMLYADLKEYLPVFSTCYSGIAATFNNEQRVVPGFLYIKNTTSISRLTQFLLQEAPRGQTEMVVLAEFNNLENGLHIDYLPVIPPEYINKYPLISIRKHRTDFPEHFFKNYGKFSSIFDAAALGQYLGGGDPRNKHNCPPGACINPSCLFNPSYFTFEWQEDSEGRKVPFAIFEGKKIKINNLHIHSKNVEPFYSGKS